MSDNAQRTWSEVEEIAASAWTEPLIPIQSTDYDLFIDLDAGRDLNYDVLDLLIGRAIIIPGVMLVTTSKSGKGNHVYFRLCKPLDLHGRVALQAALGSDLMREALAVVKLQLGAEVDALSVLFETKAEAERVREWMADMTIQLATTRLLGKPA